MKEREGLAEKLAHDEEVQDLLAEAVRRALARRKEHGLQVVVWDQGHIRWQPVADDPAKPPQ